MLTLFDLIIATALLAGLGVVVASIRSFMATCALGLILWLPANALADEMAVLVDENTAGRVVAAIANISFILVLGIVTLIFSAASPPIN